MEAAGKESQAGESFSTRNNNNAERQRQMASMAEWFEGETPSSLIKEMTRPGIDLVDQRRAFNELMDHVDAELTARGMGFQRRTDNTNTQVPNWQPANATCGHSVGGTSQTLTPDTEPAAAAGSSTTNPNLLSLSPAGDVALNDAQAPVPAEVGASSTIKGDHLTASSTVATALAGRSAIVSILTTINSNDAAPGMMTNRSATRPRENDIFERNVRFRTDPNFLEFIPPAYSRLTQKYPVQSPSGQTAMCFPYHHFANSHSPTHQFGQFPVGFQNQHVPGARGVASSPPYAQSEFGSSSHMAASVSLGNGNRSIHGYDNAIAQNNSRLGHSDSRVPGVPVWLPQQAINYSNRMVEVMRGAASGGVQGDYHPLHAIVGNMRYQAQRASRLMPRPAGQETDHPGRPSQPHNYGLTLVHRDGRLRIEGIMGNTNSPVMLGVPDDDDDDEDEEEEDEHEDMRLDIDEMTYEELLALGNEMGQVSTGLREDAILAYLSVHRYNTLKAASPDTDAAAAAAALCCICQEKYAEGEHVGKLDCGHEFHANCIKLWLMQKNKCPICKVAGLACKQRQSTSPLC